MRYEQAWRAYDDAAPTLAALRAAAFIQACDRMHLTPGDVLYVGDNLHTDALAASRAGLRGVWLNRHCAVPSHEPWRTINSLDDLVAFEHQF